MYDFIHTSLNKSIKTVMLLWKKYKEALFVTSHQYRLRFLHYQPSKKHNQVVAFIQIIIKRIKIKFSLRYLSSNKTLMQDIHPIDACRIAFISCFESNKQPIDNIPDYIQSHDYSCPIIKQQSTIRIISQSFNAEENKIMFTLQPTGISKEIIICANDLVKNHDLLYGLGSLAAMAVGHCAAEDLLRTDKTTTKKAVTNKNIRLDSVSKRPYYYHILCVAYVALLLAGISIVRRMFPFHLPGTEFVVHFGAGIIFFPLTFAIQDITTEVYGYSYSRQMVWLAILMILFYVLYTQIAINLPVGSGPIYDNIAAFSTVYSTIPRQLLALIVSMLAGSLINDFFLSKSKVIFAGQYLWARLLGSTMIGEAVLQVVGGIIGFSDTLDFYSELLPNMGLAYGYKQLWNAAMIPVIYMITSYLKKREGIDVYDYDVDYNPFVLSLNKIK